MLVIDHHASGTLKRIYIQKVSTLVLVMSETLPTATLLSLLTIPHISKLIFTSLGGKSCFLSRLVCKRFYNNSQVYLPLLQKLEHDCIGELSKDVNTLMLLDDFVWNINNEIFLEFQKAYAQHRRQEFVSDMSMFPWSGAVTIMGNVSDGKFKRISIGRLWVYPALPKDADILDDKHILRIKDGRWTYLRWFLKSGHIYTFLRYLQSIDVKEKIGYLRMVYGVFII